MSVYVSGRSVHGYAGLEVFAGGEETHIVISDGRVLGLNV